MSKKRPKENTHQFPEQIELAIKSYCEANLSAYNPKDPTAYANKVYSNLENEFYVDDVWEKNYSGKSKQKTLEYINNYVSKYIPEYQKQSLLSILSTEEQQVQSLLQKYNSHNKYTEPLKESNSEEVENQIIALDAMSRLFVKNPYSSLVHKVGEDNILYLGFNSNEKVMSLKKMNEKDFTKNSNVLKIVTAFRDYILEQSGKNIQELLRCLQNDTNPILGNILKTLKITPDIKIASLHENQQKVVLDKLINKTEIKFIIQYGFHNNNIIESYPYGHAEMNALAHARGLHGGNIVTHNESQYIIGLASANYGKIDIKGQLQGTQPFSCMGCSAEIEVLNKEENLDISIGYTSIDSMQYSEFYRPSLNIIRSTGLTTVWCSVIEESITNPEQTKDKRLSKVSSVQNQDIENNEEQKQDFKENKKQNNESKGFIRRSDDLDLITNISELDDRGFELFWSVYHNAEAFKLQNVVGNLYKYAYSYILKFNQQNVENAENYIFGSGKTISDMEYQLIDIEINAIGKQLLSIYNINYIGSTGQGISIGVDNALPTQVDAQPIIGIYNPGNGFYGHWITFVIVKVNEDKYTVYLKDSFGSDIDKYPGLKQAIEKKYGAEKIDFIHHVGNEQKQDGTSCGICALANAEIIAKWLMLDKEDKDFDKIEFVTSEGIQNLRNQYNQTNIELQKNQEDESETSQFLSDNLTKVLIMQEPYKKVLQKLQNLFPDITIQQEEWISNTNNFKTFSASNTENTIFVGISFGENRSLINAHQYNITIEVSNNISEREQNIIENILKENNLEELVIDKGIFVAAFDSLPNIKGNNEMQEGLSTIAVNSNLASIILLSRDNLDFYIAPKIMSQKELLLNLNDWKIASSSHYGALIKIENEIGNKHAVLLYASKVQNQVVITITDPLSNEDSTFKSELEKLAQSLHEQGTIVDVMYSGRQNKDYATCADMSLIMLQELVELEANMIHKKVLNDIVTFTHASYENCAYHNQIHNFDYYGNSQHIDLLGQGHHDTI